MRNEGETLKKLEGEARRLRKAENWDEEAIRANTRILEVDSRNFAALNRRARCYRERGDLSTAKEDYFHALELDPGNENIRTALEEIEEEVRKQREYEALIEKIRSITGFAEAYEMGRVHKDKSPAKRRIAVEAFKQAFRIDRSRFDVLIELAAVHRTLRQRDEAERSYEWVLRRRESSAAKIGLVAIYKDKKRLRDGLKLCEEVIELEPHNYYALRCRAGILSELDRGVEAMESFERSFG